MAFVALLIAWSTALAADDGLDPAADVVATLLDRARSGELDAAWIEAHIRPPPIGWSNTARTTWMHALAPEGPLTLALKKAGGVLLVAREEGPARVVVEGSPMLSFLVDESGTATIIGVEATTCASCDERTRFVRDLLADVRRRGAVGPRLRVGMELDVADRVAAHRSSSEDRWSEGLDLWLRTDTQVADRLANATVIGHEGDIVRIQYEDGVEDTWRVVWHTPGGWRIDYASLAPDSALAFSEADAVAWRKSETGAATTLASWRPPWRALADGAGRVIGQGAVGAALDLRTDTVVIAVISTDRSASALFRVDPYSGAVTQRIAVPLFSENAAYPAGLWYRRWPFALAPDGQHAAVATPDGVVLTDLTTSATSRLPRHPAQVTALAYADDGTLLEGLSDGRLVWASSTWSFKEAGAVIAIQADPQTLSIVTQHGEVWQIDRGTGESERRRVACAGVATDAAFRPRDASWLVTCGGEGTETHEVVPWFRGEVYGYPGLTRPGAGAAWTGDGNHYALPGPGGIGVEIWDDLENRPEVHMGRYVLRDTAFDMDGEHLLGLTVGGDVLWWDLVAARRLHFMAETDPPTGGTK